MVRHRDEIFGPGALVEIELPLRIPVFGLPLSDDVQETDLAGVAVFANMGVIGARSLLIHAARIPVAFLGHALRAPMRPHAELGVPEPVGRAIAVRQRGPIGGEGSALPRAAAWDAATGPSAVEAPATPTAPKRSRRFTFISTLPHRSFFQPFMSDIMCHPVARVARSFTNEIEQSPMIFIYDRMLKTSLTFRPHWSVQKRLHSFGIASSRGGIAPARITVHPASRWPRTAASAEKRRPAAPPDSPH